VQAGGTGFVQVEAPLLVLATHRTPAVACSTAWWELSVSALEPWQDHHRGATPQARARQSYLERRVIACCTASCGVELARHQRVHQKPERCDLALRVQIGTRVRRGRRIPLHAVWRSDRDRGGWRSLASSRRRGLLAGGHGERPSGREPFECTLHLPHLRHPDGVRHRPLPRHREDPVRRGRHLAAAPYRRRIPDQGRNNRTTPSPYAVGPQCRPGAIAPTILRPVPRRTRAPADVSPDPLLDTALTSVWTTRAVGGGRTLSPYPARCRTVLTIPLLSTTRVSEWY
jgi:hypothetical protein